MKSYTVNWADPEYPAIQSVNADPDGELYYRTLGEAKREIDTHCAYQISHWQAIRQGNRELTAARATTTTWGHSDEWVLEYVRE
jgi:hypothetical protein